MATVPRAAADWIIQYLAGPDLPNWRAAAVVELGLDVLKVSQLKRIWHAVESHTPVRHPSSHAKKAVWVDCVRRVFYEDANCQLPNTTILKKLPKALPTRAAVAPAPAVASHSPSHPLDRQAVVAHAPSPAAAPSQQPAAAVHHSPHPHRRAHRPVAHAQQHGAAHAPHSSHAGHAPIQYILPPDYSNLSSFVMHTGIPQQHSPRQPGPPPPVVNNSRKKVKREEQQQHQLNDNDAAWEARPRTLQENGMVSQLRQMGFTDMREMLAGIRHVVSSPSADLQSHVDAAMMWIVSQREEVEESRKIDDARARSEMLRTEQARLRKKAAHERLWGSSMDDWLSQPDLFQGSVILSETRVRLEPLISVRKEYKETLIKFLELEKKARKWYGRTVPWAYLVDLAELWKKVAADEELIKRIKRETCALESAMYALSEQQGGVPKLFLNARLKAQTNGSPLGPGIEDAAAIIVGDDDVVVVKEVPAFPLGSREGAGNDEAAQVEVIEIF